MKNHRMILDIRSRVGWVSGRRPRMWRELARENRFSDVLLRQTKSFLIAVDVSPFWIIFWWIARGHCRSSSLLSPLLFLPFPSSPLPPPSFLPSDFFSHWTQATLRSNLLATVVTSTAPPCSHFAIKIQFAGQTPPLASSISTPSPCSQSNPNPNKDIL
jgi:hypothetical protein